LKPGAVRALAIPFTHDDKALRVATAWLVYAGRGLTSTRRILHMGIAVVEYALHLAAAPRALLARVDVLAGQARAMLACEQPPFLQPSAAQHRP
jgi:hypothetical protein